MSPSKVDPRAQRTRAAALAAAAELLGEGGPGAVTHAAVAERSGVGRATVYRHWPQQQHLLLDALADSTEPLLSVGEGAVRDQLVRQLAERLDWFNQSLSASVTAALIDQAERDPRTREMRQLLYGTAVEQLRAALRTGAKRGELRAGADDHAALLLTRIMGPLFFRRYLLGQALDEEFVVRSVDNALASWMPYA
ncbi:TetR/AcrR family transcriptional regulator C-terminal ligand-binding domain-containing protein [Streptomyces sp. NPDC096176]|uniref:TetR/AcrR family transcriptional regulator n=1 Tax=Streptomyces sp. NPDC096176 TaxID=3366079 RepID=UPI0038146AC0